MTELDIRMVVEEIEAWRNGERGSKLTWAKLERIFPFTRQTMYSKERIRMVYDRKEKVLLKQYGEGKKLVSIEILSLKNRIKELESQIEEYQKFFLNKLI